MTSYHAYLNVLMSPTGEPVEAAVHNVPGYELPTVHLRPGPHRWACLLRTGGTYPDHHAGRRAILELVEQQPGLLWVKPLLEAA